MCLIEEKGIRIPFSDILTSIFQVCQHWMARHRKLAWYLYRPDDIPRSSESSTELSGPSI